MKPAAALPRSSISATGVPVNSTCGLAVLSPSATFSTPPKDRPAGRRDAWIAGWLPDVPRQIAIASPLSLTATRELKTLLPDPDSGW